MMMYRFTRELRLWPAWWVWLVPLAGHLLWRLAGESPLGCSPVSLAIIFARAIPLFGIILLGQVPSLPESWGIGPLTRIHDSQPGITIAWRWSVGTVCLALTALPLTMAGADHIFAQSIVAGTVSFALSYMAGMGAGLTVPLLWWVGSQVLLLQRPDLVADTNWGSWLVAGTLHCRQPDSVVSDPAVPVTMYGIAVVLLTAVVLGSAMRKGPR